MSCASLFAFHCSYNCVFHKLAWEMPRERCHTPLLSKKQPAFKLMMMMMSSLQSMLIQIQGRLCIMIWKRFQRRRKMIWSACWILGPNTLDYPLKCFWKAVQNITSLGPAHLPSTLHQAQTFCIRVDQGILSSRAESQFLIFPHSELNAKWSLFPLEVHGRCLEGNGVFCIHCER